jgi:hypothetical protein
MMSTRLLRELTLVRYPDVGLSDARSMATK